MCILAILASLSRLQVSKKFTLRWLLGYSVSIQDSFLLLSLSPREILPTVPLQTFLLISSSQRISLPVNLNHFFSDKPRTIFCVRDKTFKVSVCTCIQCKTYLQLLMSLMVMIVVSS